MTLYVNRHVSQYAAGNSTVTRRTGCTWTSGVNGLDASTGGKVQRTPDQLHALVKPSEETNPTTAGWSMRDLDLAMSRLDVPFTNRSWSGWVGVLTQRAKGLYLVVQGDSDQFGNSTCSGAFDGDHAIGIHPDTKTDPDGSIWWWINDPICPTGRWERDTVIRAYAQKLAQNVYFGSFDVPVPQVPVRWQFHLEPLSATPNKRRAFYVYAVKNGQIVGRVLDSTLGFTAACTAPKSYPWPNSRPKRLVRLLSGSRKGKYVEARWAHEVEA